MAFFAPRSSAFYEPNYTGLFRLIDEFNNYAAEANTGSPDTAETNVGNHQAVAGPNNNNNTHVAHKNKRRSLHHNLATVWTPKFDLQETPNTFILHGELPGIDKKDINIEFTDEQTLTIRGRSERSYTHTNEGEDDDVVVVGNKKDQEQHKEGHGKEVAHQDKGKQQVAARKDNHPKVKYWVSERSYGEFARSFTFPVRVDAGGVVAKLDNGVLNLVVPKASKPQGRKITVQ